MRPLERKLVEYDVLLYKTGNLSKKTTIVVKRQCGYIKEASHPYVMEKRLKPTLHSVP